MELSKGLLLLTVLAVPALAGCFGGGGDGDGDGPDGTPSGITSVFERNGMGFDTSSTTISRVLEAGPYDIITPGTQFFTSAGLEATEGVPAVIGDDMVSIGVHFPDIPGCDWESDSLPPECNIPVIADVGPYFSATVGLPEAQTEGDAPVTEYTCGRLMCDLIDNFVPHGYAVAAVSVMGTGDSGHCMDLMGRAEQAGIQAAVEFLGTEPWSNGNVGLIGRSYDGSTPWEAAMDSPHLKTIVPISGLMGQYDLMWRNGSAETRGPGVLYGLYAAMTIDGDASDVFQVMCPDYLLGGPQGVVAYLAGSNAADPAYEYWTERYFYDEVVANYNGSIYYIHGLQDWNVDPHQAFPYYNMLLDEGFEMKGLFGQWGHMYPDRRSEHQGLSQNYGGTAYPESVRYDWTQDLLEWFDHYLMETGPKPHLWVEVQDNMGQWRVEQEYPPRDAQRVVVGFDENVGVTYTGTGVNQDVAPMVSQSHGVTLAFPPLSETDDTRIAGNVHLPITVTPTGPGGQIGATLTDAETGLRLGHAIMDLRYYAGGNEMQAVAPGMPITAMMEFFALDAVLPAGHGLELALTGTVQDYLPSSVSAPAIVDLTDASSLRIPVVARDGSTFFTPPVWYDEEGLPLDQ